MLLPCCTFSSIFLVGVLQLSCHSRMLVGMRVSFLLSTQCSCVLTMQCLIPHTWTSARPGGALYCSSFCSWIIPWPGHNHQHSLYQFSFSETSMTIFSVDVPNVSCSASPWHPWGMDAGMLAADREHDAEATMLMKQYCSVLSKIHYLVPHWHFPGSYKQTISFISSPPSDHKNY